MRVGEDLAHRDSQPFTGVRGSPGRTGAARATRGGYRRESCQARFLAFTRENGPDPARGGRAEKFLRRLRRPLRIVQCRSVPSSVTWCCLFRLLTLKRQNYGVVIRALSRYDHEPLGTAAFKLGGATNNMPSRNQGPNTAQLWGLDDATATRPPGKSPRPVPPSPQVAQVVPPSPVEERDTGSLVLLLSVEEAGTALGVSRSTVYELIGSGDLEVVHVRRSVRIPVEAIYDLIRRLRGSTRP